MAQKSIRSTMKAQLEPLIPAANRTFRSHRVEEPKFSHPLHYHPEIEITLILRGSGLRLVGDHVGEFGPGDLCLFGGNLPHRYHQATESPEGSAAEVIQFARDCAGGVFDEAPEFLNLSRLFDRASLGLRFGPKTAAQATPLFAEIRLSEGIRRWNRLLELFEVLLADKGITTLASPGYTAERSPHDSERIRRACNHILDHFDEEIDHGSVARTVHLSPSAFSRLFRRATGKTYTDFRLEVRLGHACRLLRETDQTITEIALASGFQNLSNFNRRFQKTYGRTPSAYRRLTEESPPHSIHPRTKRS